MALNPSLTRALNRELNRSLLRAEAGGAGGADPDFANVVLLLDFAGADNDTDLTDLSDSAHVDTFVFEAKIEAVTQFFLGENTLQTPGATGYVHFPDDPDWDFGTGDFTVEFGVYFQSAGTSTTIVSTYDPAAPADGWWVQWFKNDPSWRFGWGDTILGSFGVTNTSAVWYHVAVTRSGTDLRVFQDGVQLGSTVTDSTSLSGSASVLQIGRLDATLGQYHMGFIGAVRITKGVARYTANFDPLTEFYPTS